MTACNYIYQVIIILGAILASWFLVDYHTTKYELKLCKAELKRLRKR